MSYIIFPSLYKTLPTRMTNKIFIISCIEIAQNCSAIGVAYELWPAMWVTYEFCLQLVLQKYEPCKSKTHKSFFELQADPGSCLQVLRTPPPNKTRVTSQKGLSPQIHLAHIIYFY